MKLVSLTFQFIISIAVLTHTHTERDNDHQMAAETQYYIRKTNGYQCNSSLGDLPSTSCCSRFEVNTHTRIHEKNRNWLPPIKGHKKSNHTHKIQQRNIRNVNGARIYLCFLLLRHCSRSLYYFYRAKVSCNKLRCGWPQRRQWKVSERSIIFNKWTDTKITSSPNEMSGDAKH